jgi:hypothetical protein
MMVKMSKTLNTERHMTMATDQHIRVSGTKTPIWEKGEAIRSSPMVLFMKDIGWITSITERADSLIKTALITMVNGKQVKSMARVLRLVNRANYTKGNSNMVDEQVTEISSLRMVQHMKGSFEVISMKAKALSIGMTKTNMRVNGSEGSAKETELRKRTAILIRASFWTILGMGRGQWFGRTDTGIRGNGRKGKCTEKES